MTYIDREAFQQALIDLPADLDAKTMQRCIEVVHNFPVADVQPVARAVWLAEKDGVGICSNCNRLDHIDPLATHCRYCGAEMYAVTHWMPSPKPPKED